ncbi:biotin transporter BioY [Clostridium sp. 'deep sea']|uniref:biotin transporter BioY n=1 Tax=Clostridium sp. 'deep sea' TaxID=2779445 RepID=UPI0018966F89|nr:biotin transporter BioY [Clostridium sp. 'deep sea']QOR35459.1 biotin transporter BioY [Clostridium sp. 'deep sea']
MTFRKNKLKIYDYIICSLFAALTAVGAFIKIPLPPPLVDFTLQFLFAALAGLILGSKKGAISQMVYIAVGLAGVPVFTKGGGIRYIFQPSFGYLLGFILCAYITGKIRETGKLTFTRSLSACLLGLLVIYGLGVPYMYLIFNFYMGQAYGIWTLIWGGAIICAPGDLLLCIVATLASLRVIPALQKQGYIT